MRPTAKKHNKSLNCMKSSHLAVGEVQVIAHFHRQRAPAAAAEVHDAVLAAAVRDVVDREHPLAR